MPTNFARRAILTIALGGIVAPPAAAQLVSVAEGPLRPYAGPGEQPSARGMDPSPFLRFYATAALTASGGLADGGVGAGPSAAAFQFPAVRLTLSVTPRMLAADSSAREQSRMGDLLRLNAHVTVHALDASGHVMPDVKELPGVQTLALSPGDPTMAAPVASNAASEVKAAADLIESSLGVAGRIISAFESAFHRSPRPTEVPYQATANEFGWAWFAATDTPIGGLHNTAALLQVPLDAKSLRLAIEVVSDWRKYGPWVKTYDIVIALK